jgi:hypothetical protein
MPRATTNKTVAADAAPAEPVVKSTTRKSPVPRSTKAKATTNAEPASTKAAPTADQIAQRAYELWQNGTPGSELDHWLMAERELR